MIYPEEFLLNLEQDKNKEVYARITSLTKDELPIEYIEGKVTGGSINIDGASCIRRTCSLSMIANDVKINDFYWGFKNKFKLEIGVKNNINSNYDNIIWFKQGVYVITSFNCSLNVNSYTININGKDKMCLLNGDIGGNLSSTVDFGVQEYYDNNTGLTTYENIPIKTIIKEAVHAYGDELVENIVINDLEQCGLNAMEYRGDIPLFLFKNNTTQIWDQMTINPNQKCKIYETNQEVSVSDDTKIVYDNLIDDVDEIINKPTIIYFGEKNENTILRTTAKIEYGTTVGYQMTDLTYAGDLIAQPGETLTSVLDKIVKMLGDFEYFYNLDGQFVFQAQPCNVNIVWGDLANSDPSSRIHKAINHQIVEYNFNNSNLITSFQNNPNLLNLKNDFTVWGKKKTSNGSEIKIHMRCAIDEKPSVYCGIKKINNELQIDWSRIYISENYYDYNKINIFSQKYNEKVIWPARDQAIDELTTQYNNTITILENSRKERLNAAKNIYLIEKERIANTYSSPLTRNIYNIQNETNYANNQNIINNEINANIDSTTINFNNQKNEIINSYISQEFKIEDHIYDWRELLYQMAIDYYKYNTDDNFYYIIHQANDWTDNGKTQYEKYYADIEGFWRQLYNPNPSEENIYDANTYWITDLQDNPENLIFWFDFFDISGELAQYQIRSIGDRTKVINEDSVKTIYYRYIPNVIFISPNEEFERETGYSYIQIQPYMKNLFVISQRGVSAKDKIDTLLNEYSYGADTITINTIPIYRLEPNTVINIVDNKTQISGEYIINKITIPLAYNGIMSINAQKNVNSIV